MKGLIDKGLETFDCTGCGRNLLVIQLTTVECPDEEAKDVMTRVAVHCGACGGFSYVKEIHGRFHPGAPDDDTSFDVVDCGTIDGPDVDVLFKSWRK